MTEFDLISAIGAAGCDDLEHSQQTRTGKRSRLGTRLLIAAAVIALLSATVFAVPAFRNALFGASTNQKHWDPKPALTRARSCPGRTRTATTSSSGRTPGPTMPGTGATIPSARALMRPIRSPRQSWAASPSSGS